MRAGWRFVLSLIVAIVITIVSTLAADAAAHNHLRGFALVYGTLSAFLLIMVFSALLLMADRVEHPLRRLGFPPIHRARDLAAGCGFGALMISVAVAGIAVSGKLSFHVATNVTVVALVGAEFLVLAVNALSEELMFRSYPLLTLMEAGSAGVAIGITSVLFGVAHLGNPHTSVLAIVNTILVGALLGVARVRSHALWLPWGIHFGWNFALGVGYGLPVSGLNDFAVAAQAQASGPTWLTGGPYGIEGGALGTIAIVAGFIPVLLWTRQATAGPPS